MRHKIQGKLLNHVILGLFFNLVHVFLWLAAVNVLRTSPPQEPTTLEPTSPPVGPPKVFTDTETTRTEKKWNLEHCATVSTK